MARHSPGRALLGLSKLSLGWMKMGIIHERIQPGRPQQNGRHERMHRTLKTRPSTPDSALRVSVAWRSACSWP
jgi:transposase InsO family protein